MFLDSTSDAYWAVNMDNFYWVDENAVMNTVAGTVLAAVSEYVHTEPSWGFATTYKMEEPKLVEYHASKATPQYGFHRGIKEFGNDRREATRQELYKNQ